MLRNPVPPLEPVNRREMTPLERNTSVAFQDAMRSVSLELDTLRTSSPNLHPIDSFHDAKMCFSIAASKFFAWASSAFFLLIFGLVS
jgi:hypothetical protein